MRNGPQNLPVQFIPLMGIGPRLAKLGCDQLESAMGLQAKLVERDCAAALRAGDALEQARMADMGGFLQTWRTLMREWIATSETLWNEEITVAARNQGAFGALLRDMVVEFERAWMHAPAQVPQLAGPALLETDWPAYFGRLTGVLADGEARPVKPVGQPVSVRA
jgi:hypothetical protein